MNSINNNSQFVLPDNRLPYPRICAHRGFPLYLPENSLISFAGVHALGAKEIELDIWPSKDGKLVVCHDPSIDRTSDRTGEIQKLTYDEILKADIGPKISPFLKNIRIPALDEVLAMFAKRVIINLHIKSPSPEKEYDSEVFKQIIDLIDMYDCREYIYIAGARDVMETAIKMAPYLNRDCLEGDHTPNIVEYAIEYKCSKLQFFKPHYSQEQIDKAHSHGIRCNMFWSDDLAEARDFINMGIDTILTNNYPEIMQLKEITNIS
jgi:glycerophosphoryl diester phosphodiesterase